MRRPWSRPAGDIERNVAAHAPGIRLDGWLVARMATAGLELVLGMQRDPGDGRGDHVRRRRRMAGTGEGRGLRTARDHPREGAARLIDSHSRRTAAGRLPWGGGPTTGTPSSKRWWRWGRLAAAAGDVIESLDVNPFLVLPQGRRRNGAGRAGGGRAGSSPAFASDDHSVIPDLIRDPATRHKGGESHERRHRTRTGGASTPGPRVKPGVTGVVDRLKESKHHGTRPR